jgi:hypothetical protein
MSSDNGYFSGNNIQAFVDENIDTYIATGKGEKDKSEDEETGKLDTNKFSYDIEKDTFTCPNGKNLEVKNHNGKKIYTWIFLL